ncbi:hypothetical protein C6P40_001834 [Pichia californica]|uniref:Uncharacterized protein n=1 Tax=Pichia californica TaxID=460514 RepID=A0A9P7BF85_9ASCO|nr:hypothetical protein C6P42_001752 [[Candida] californica]KAG0687830.1 hypothetical protein C6P40_001834 [[Candida] californica]
MSVLFECRLSKVSEYNSDIQQWKSFQSFGLSFNIKIIKNLNSEIDLIINHENNELFKILNINNNNKMMKIYKREPDLAIKYFDLNFKNWKKLQITLDLINYEFNYYLKLIKFFEIFKIEIINKELGNSNNSNIKDLSDDEFLNYLNLKIKDPEFILLVC